MVAAMAVEVIVNLYILCFIAAAGIAIALLVSTARHLGERDRKPTNRIEK